MNQGCASRSHGVKQLLSGCPTFSLASRHQHSRYTPAFTVRASWPQVIAYPLRDPDTATGTPGKLAMRPQESRTWSFSEGQSQDKARDNADQTRSAFWHIEHSVDAFYLAPIQCTPQSFKPCFQQRSRDV